MARGKTGAIQEGIPPILERPAHRLGHLAQDRPAQATPPLPQHGRPTYPNSECRCTLRQRLLQGAAVRRLALPRPGLVATNTSATRLLQTLEPDRQWANDRLTRPPGTQSRLTDHSPTQIGDAGRPNTATDTKTNPNCLFRRWVMRWTPPLFKRRRDAPHW